MVNRTIADRRRIRGSDGAAVFERPRSVLSDYVGSICSGRLLGGQEACLYDRRSPWALPMLGQIGLGS